MSDLQLKSIIERILRLHQEEDELKADRREIYAEAKANGYDKTALGAAVSLIRKKEKLGVDDFDQRDAMVALYVASYEGPARVLTHTLAYARTREAELNASPDLSPATQNEGAAGASPEQEAPDSADGGVFIVAAQGAAFVTQVGTGEGVPASDEPAPTADAKPFARLLRHQDCRPHCKKPDACGSASLDHCFVCKQAMAAAGQEAA